MKLPLLQEAQLGQVHRVAAMQNCYACGSCICRLSGRLERSGPVLVLESYVCAENIAFLQVGVGPLEPRMPIHAGWLCFFTHLSYHVYLKDCVFMGDMLPTNTLRMAI